MTGQFQEISVRLQRDSLTTPWGFRLQGGKDFKTPLTVQRVFVGSPGHFDLQRGDIITAIDNHPTINMTHKEAQTIIKNTGGQLSLRLKRGARRDAGPTPSAVAQPSPLNQLFRSHPADITPHPKPMAGAYGFVPKPRPHVPISTGTQEFGTDYSHKGRYGPRRAGPPEGSMLNRVQHSLNAAIWQPGQEEIDPEYELRSVGELKQMFGGTRIPKPSSPEEEGRSVTDLKKVFSGNADLWSHAAYDPSPRSRPIERVEPATATRSAYRPGFQSQPHSTAHSGGGSRVWKRPDPGVYGESGLAEPGWVPGKKRETGWAPVRSPGHGFQSQRSPTIPVNQPQPQQHYQSMPPASTQQQQYGGVQHEEPRSPAWQGSLKTSGGPRPWDTHAAAVYGEAYAPHAGHAIPWAHRREESPPAQQPQHQQQQHHHQPQPQQQQQHYRQRPQDQEAPAPHTPRVQTVHYAPGQAPVYEGHDPNQEHPDAKIVHLQYNTPIGLYSKDNVVDVLQSQTHGKPGEGTMQVTGGQPGKNVDFSKSDLYRMIHAEDESRRHPGSAHAHAHVHHGPPQPVDVIQSPSMYALEAQVQGISLDDEGFGTSDF